MKYADIIVWDRQAVYNSMCPLGYPYKFIINKMGFWHTGNMEISEAKKLKPKPKLNNNDLYEVATYLAMPQTRTEIRAELPERHQLKFEDEYKTATGTNPPVKSQKGPYYVWPNNMNKHGKELRIYFKRVPPVPPSIRNLYTDQGKWYIRKNLLHINHSALVMQLFECGFLLGSNEKNVKRIEQFMKKRFPAGP